MSPADWTLTDVAALPHATGLAHYGILDTYGVPIGYVSGWVQTAQGETLLLKFTIRVLAHYQDYLVPAGAIQFIDDHNQRIGLQQLTRLTLQASCLPYDGDLPSAQVLQNLIRYFPNPRPSLLERLRYPDATPHPPPPARHILRGAQGDGDTDTPAFLALRITRPPWRPLRDL